MGPDSLQRLCSFAFARVFNALAMAERGKEPVLGQSWMPLRAPSRVPRWEHLSVTTFNACSGPCIMAMEASRQEDTLSQCRRASTQAAVNPVEFAARLSRRVRS